MPNQYRAFWSIPNAGPSVTTFHMGDDSTSVSAAQAIADAVHDFFADIAGWLPNEVAVTFDTEVTRINTASGTLADAIPVTAPATVAGTGTGTWAAGSGARVVWSTGAIREGRRVVGSTFVVPTLGAAFNTSGRVSSAVLTVLNDAAEDLRATLSANPSSTLVVYSRPRPGIPGAVSEVIAGAASAQAATLRGRKY